MAATTGSAELPDIGVLSYSTPAAIATFSSLVHTNMSGKPTLSADNRTVKYVEYTLTVEGIVTLDDDAGASTTDNQMRILRQALEYPAGVLSYTGRGFGDIIVNSPSGSLFDVNWGPVPKLFDFIPLGAMRSAQIKWQVVFCIPETIATNLNLPVLQFNSTNEISYDQDGYSTLTYLGTLEIPLTRQPNNPTVPVSTVDGTAANPSGYRKTWLGKITDTFDLTRFKITRRDLNFSRDLRTLEFNFVAQEQPPMGNPAGILTAKGSFVVRQLKPGPGSAQWMCVLSATYTIPKNLPRRVAYEAFVSMWSFRMRQAQLGNMANIQNIYNDPRAIQSDFLVYAGYRNLLNAGGVDTSGFGGTLNGKRAPYVPAGSKAIMMNFVAREGLYEDSKTISFEASWQVTTRLFAILRASGFLQTSDIEGGNSSAPNMWALSVKKISGPVSWLQNSLDPASFAIVDFGT
jgi:hypothetical protein